MMNTVMRAKSILLLLSLACLLSLAACSDEKAASVCNAPTATQPRAPEGDSLCASGAVCGTSGQPDHDGCPNTCSCACYEGQCYQRSCTAIACSDQPVYR